MSYDFDDVADHSAPIMTNYKPQPHDLETIVVLLQLAAISLTPTPGTLFSYQELLIQARQLAGDFVLEDTDAKIVFQGLSCFKKEKKKLFSLK
jgi:hypothetical protein